MESDLKHLLKTNPNLGLGLSSLFAKELRTQTKARRGIFLLVTMFFFNPVGELGVGRCLCVCARVFCTGKFELRLVVVGLSSRLFGLWILEHVSLYFIPGLMVFAHP